MTGGIWGDLSATYAAKDVIAPLPTGVAATDRAALVAAIAATPNGGILRLRRGTYVIDQALSITKHMTIEGTSKSDNFLTVGSGGSLNHPNTPGPLGTVIKQTTAATDIFNLSGGAFSVHIRDLGLTFDTGIINTNTGHGINASSTVVPGGGGHATGLVSSSIQNVTVYGHDGNHYAYFLLNPLYVSLRDVRGYGGGGLWVQCDSTEGNFGNLTAEHPYFEVYNLGTAGGIMLASRTASGATGVLNLLKFVRPQVNVTGAAAGGGTQYMWNSLAGANLPRGVDVDAPDLEGAGGNPINFGGVNSGTSVRSTGILNGTPAGDYDMGPGANYKAFTGAGSYSFVVPDGCTRLRVRAIGGGGGGGGGGSASAVTNQVGGGGGGAGIVCDATVTVTPNATYTVTVGAAGTAGTLAAANGNAGGTGGNGGQSSFGSLVRGNGGGGGAGGGANTNANAGGGKYGQSGTSTTVGLPGCGGVSQSPNGNSATQLPPGVCGGGAGGAAGATNGGGAGTAATSGFPTYFNVGGGSGSASGTATGVDGQTATCPGCGGGGGGGGAPTTGAGGAGGAGAPGMVEVWW